jgi:hypothetical protein
VSSCSPTLTTDSWRVNVGLSLSEETAVDFEVAIAAGLNAKALSSYMVIRQSRSPWTAAGI